MREGLDVAQKKVSDLFSALLASFGAGVKNIFIW